GGKKKDPLIQCRKNLVENWGYTDAQLKAVEEEIAQQIARDEAWALEQPKPTLEYAISNVMVPVAGRKA
ncbi:MAG: hypothetical protein NTX88_07370, partial [Candidatus Atribacteria bacterium]|nr:hypothetical protein [Candidatus Atribacteria bacterium]